MGVWIRLFEFVFENKNSSLEKCTELCYKHSKEYQGKSYPYVTLDISSASHPFYTGEVRQVGNEGRVASFNKRFSRFKR